MTRDHRLVLPALAAWAGAAAAVRGQGVPALVAGACVALAATFAALVGRRAQPGGGARRAGVLVPTVAAVAACLAAGALAGQARVAGRDAGPVAGWAAGGATVQAAAVLTADPRAAPAGEPPRTWATARLDAVTRAGTTVAVRTPVLLVGESWPALLTGARLAAAGRLSPAPPGRPYAAVLTVTRLRVDAPAGRLAAAVEPLRRGLREAAAGLPGGADGLLPALVVGDETALDPAVAERLREAGLSHLTAVSGANVAIAVGMVVAVALLAGARARAVQVVGVLGVLAFVAVARAQPSVLRAAVMAVVLLLAVGVGGRRRGVASLAVAVLVLVLADPWLATAPGFLLSVAATGGLVVLAPGWTEAAARWLPRPLAAALAVTLAAQVAVTPVLALLDGDAPLAGVPANLLAEPAVAPATVLGLAAAVASLVHPGAAAAIAAAAGVPTRWIAAVAGWAADLPAGPASPPALLAVLAATAVALLLVPRVLRSPAGCVAAAGCLVLLLARPPVVAGWPPPGWLVVACDVGQGDALVLRSGPGRAVVVDAGPAPEPVRRCLDRLGVRAVDTLVLSHFHLDHVGGVPGVMAGRPLAEIVVSPLAEPPEQARRLQQQAAAAGVPVTSAAPGEVRQAGEVAWRVLWPRRIIRGEGSDPNNASVVLLAQVAGVRVLLAGDVEPAAQAALRRAEPGLRVDVLKVPHHGSAHQDEALLTGLQASVALVSAGRDNDYGHPAPETLRLLARAGLRVARTDTSGALAVVRRADGTVQVLAQHG